VNWRGLCEYNQVRPTIYMVDSCFLFFGFFKKIKIQIDKIALTHQATDRSGSTTIVVTYTDRSIAQTTGQVYCPSLMSFTRFDQYRSYHTIS
jgi:hypothetical protein